MASISGRVAASTRLGFEDAREQRQLAENFAREEDERQHRKVLALRRIGNEEQQMRDTLARQQKMDERLARADKLDEARLTMDVADEGYDPMSGVPVEVSEDQAKILEGTPYAARVSRDTNLEARPIVPELEGAMEATPRKRISLKPTTGQNTLRQTASRQRETEAAIREMETSPNTPPALRQVLALRRRGIHVQPSAEMLLSPEERAAAEESDLKRIEKIADVQARTAARYRAPKEQSYEKVETVDDKGNPIIKYMTPEEVRSEGGVRGVPKTTAKAQGPATVDAILGEIEVLSGRINTGSAGPITKATGLLRRGAGALNLDDDVAEYESLILGFTPIVARAVGHIGVLTEQDVQSVRSLFPRPGDSQTLANNKLKRVRSLMAKIQPAAAMPSEATPPMRLDQAPPASEGPMPAFRFNPKTGKLEPVK